jgi:LPXTG-motif cell wall-anchored protein
MPSTRRLTTLAGAAFIAAAATAVMASPASAHAVGLSGTSDCVDGKWKVSWTVHDNHTTTATVTAVQSTPATAPVKNAAGITLARGVEIQPGDTNDFKGIQLVDAKETSASLKVTVTWADRVTDTKGPIVVQFHGKCGNPCPPSAGNDNGNGNGNHENEGNEQGQTAGGHRPSTCPTPTPTPTATATKPAAPAAPSLPVTGSQTGLYAGGAVVLLAAGGGLFMVARRRRLKFQA